MESLSLMLNDEETNKILIFVNKFNILLKYRHGVSRESIIIKLQRVSLSHETFSE